ncbi:hypothetical protein DIS24_g4482 [Lasiodiplodia hormozganensis]|uniref:Uncharacterized protein n=1 Tax=Lasiodiplodia hormozganensis TaxID=869390 RepID=A0AA39YUL1_9PEZI|nr:hypothetical protein DIS24_g4482 [Lasiodiplodia hormozganensis]
MSNGPANLPRATKQVEHQLPEHPNDSSSPGRKRRRFLTIRTTITNGGAGTAGPITDNTPKKDESTPPAKKRWYGPRPKGYAPDDQVYDPAESFDFTSVLPKNKDDSQFKMEPGYGKDDDLQQLLCAEGPTTRDEIVEAVKQKQAGWVTLPAVLEITDSDICQGADRKDWTKTTNLELRIRETPQKGATYLKKLKKMISQNVDTDVFEAALPSPDISNFYKKTKEQINQLRGQKVVPPIGFCLQYNMVPDETPAETYEDKVHGRQTSQQHPQSKQGTSARFSCLPLVDHPRNSPLPGFLEMFTNMRKAADILRPMKEQVTIDAVLRIDEAAMDDLNQSSSALRLNYKTSLPWDIISQEGDQQDDQGKGIAVMTALVSEYLMISDGSQVPPSPQHASYEKALLMRFDALRKVPDYRWIIIHRGPLLNAALRKLPMKAFEEADLFEWAKEFTKA